VAVTASRGAPILEAPASASVVTSAELASAAAGTVDDALRGTPGFSLFRRSSSRVTNPTAQGVTLRGISGSGASRTLVLADGLPLNDPFGSWVYWNRIPMAAIERIDVVRGAPGDTYGTDALGGIVQIVTFSPDRRGLRTALEAASLGTARASLFGGWGRRGWTASGAGEWMTTDGYPLVAPEERGAIDIPASSEYLSGFASVGYSSGAWQAGLRASTAAESRGNGTPLQRNDTNWHRYSGTLIGPAAGGLWKIQGATGTQTYVQTFSSVSPARDRERLTNEQRIPTTFVDLSAHWVRLFGRHAVLAGAEARRAEAEVRETRYSLAGTPSGPFLSGGSETLSSLFARASVAPHDAVSVIAGARVDFWRPVSRDPAATRSGETGFSPRFSVSWRARDSLMLFGSAYQASRTPTPNELYRGFRAGNVVTSPNAALVPERLTGAEGGVRVVHGGASLRVTAYTSSLVNAVTNVTTASTPTLITRQRQNTDTIRADGLEAELQVRSRGAWSFTGHAVLSSSRFAESPAQPAIEGNRVPQVPRFSVGASVTWAHARLATITTELRVVGDQFEDDQNTLVLRRYGQVDVAGILPLARAAQTFVALENAFGTQADVGRTPVLTLGYPRSVRVGVRVFLP
jgi:outer membrane receptor protein involved in Fe transport